MSDKPLVRDGSVYLVRCKPNGKVYVGATLGPVKKRWQQHKRDFRSGVHSNPQFQADWDTFGEAAFTVGTIETVIEDDLMYREAYWIVQLRSMDSEHGYNLASLLPVVRGALAARVRRVLGQIN